MAAAPTGILNSFAAMDGHGSDSILRNRNDIALRCDDESRSFTPLWPAVSKTGLTSLRIPRDRMKGNRLIVCLVSICRPPEASGGEMRHRFGTPLHYAFANCPVAVRCCQTAARKRSASDMEMWGQVLQSYTPRGQGGVEAVRCSSRVGARDRGRPALSWRYQHLGR